MAKTYRLTPLRRVGNVLISKALRLGLGPPNFRLLSVKGRKSGATYTTPVHLVVRNGERYVVAPYGDRGWALNARAAGELTLRLGRRSETLNIAELAPVDAVPVLRQYYKENAIARGFFDVDARSSDTAFAAEAPRHPAFRLE